MLAEVCQGRGGTDSLMVVSVKSPISAMGVRRGRFCRRGQEWRMKSGMSWNIEVDDEARAAALKAARETGQSVTEWLSGAIADHAARSPAGTSDELAALHRLAALVENLSENENAAGGGVHAAVQEPIRQASENRDPTLEETVADLNIKVAALAAEVGSKERPVSRDQPQPRLRDRLDALVARPSVSPSGPDADRIARIGLRLSDLAARLVAAGGAPPNTPAPGATQREPAAVGDAASTPADTLAIESLRAKIDALAAQLRANVVRNTRIRTPSDADPHAAAARVPRGRDDLERIRAEIEHPNVLSETRTDKPAGRDPFDDPAARLPDREQLDTLASEISSLRDALEADMSPRTLARLEMRVSQLARTVETTLSAHKSASDAASAGVAAALADIRGALEDLTVAHGTGPDAAAVAGLATNLADIRGAVEDVAAGLSHTEVAALEGLAAGIDDIRHQLAMRDEVAPVEAAAGRLENRLDDIVARIERATLDTSGEVVGELCERLEVLAAAVDELGLRIVEPPRFEGLQDAIRVAADGAAQEPVWLGELQQQIIALSTRIDTVAGSDIAGDQLVELDARIANLAEDLERVVPVADALGQLEHRLDRLQTSLTADSAESADVARVAAVAAVREFADDRDKALRSSLRRDFDAIRLAISDRDERAETRIDSLQDLLASVIERLGRLEEVLLESQAVVAATGTYGRETAVPRSEPSLPSSLHEADESSKPNDPKADLAALRELAASAADNQSASVDRRAEFIAAARRAAQAAVHETEDTDGHASSSDPKASPFARIGQAIRNRRKSLLLVAAVAVLAIGALQVSVPRGNPGRDVAENTPPPILEAESGLWVIARPADHPAAPTVPQVDETALVAPPADARTAMDLATAEPIGDRFDAIFGTSANAAVAAPAAKLMAATVEAPLTGPAKLRVAAASGDPFAAFDIANRFAEGLGVAKDLSAAATWYRRAAESGIAVAQYRLGSLYERGRGIAKDRDSAVRWYRQAAEQGNLGAMHNLAVMLSEKGQASSTAEAMDWFRAAADLGVKDSQYNLGVIFARGLGSAADLPEAYKWFALAAAQGDDDAAQRRDDVALLLQPDQLAAARAGVTAWRAKPVVAEANSVTPPPGGWKQDSDGITVNEKVALVVKIQSLLAEQGYDPGPADGVDGPKTREAVRAFQRQMGVTATGRIDGTLVAALADDAD